MQLGLVPVVPILLFPFIIIFFIIIFPLWVVALAVLGLLLVLARLGERALNFVGARVGNRLSTKIHRAFRWVLTFNGLAERDPDEPK